MENNWWYKEDALGHESLSEILVSRLLEKSNIENYVLYEHVWIEKNGEQMNGCRSKNFLTEEDNRLISMERLFQLRKGKGAAPVFDNGAALFSDTRMEYPASEPFENCLKKIKAKPFSTDFDEQLDAAEQLYPKQPFQAWFTMKDVQMILSEVEGFYDPAAVRRIEELMRQQFRKYFYLFHE